MQLANKRKPVKKCLRCHRVLKDNLAIERGYGTTCYKRMMKELESGSGLFNLAPLKLKVGEVKTDEID